MSNKKTELIFAQAMKRQQQEKKKPSTSEAGKSAGGKKGKTKPAASLQASKLASNKTNKQVSKQTNKQVNNQSVIETVCKSVRDYGAYPATFRFTQEEKRAIKLLSFAFEEKGVKVHQNEIIRIAVNFIIEDHRQNGKNSVLEKAITDLQ